ncbi:MAG: hypothetical protein V4724_09845 [Pseudomonadota bacterium]
MDSLTRQIGETLVARGAVAAVSRWGALRVAGFLALAALAAYMLTAHGKPALAAAASPALPAPDAGAGRDAAAPDEERRRTPEPEQNSAYPDGPRTLH